MVKVTSNTIVGVGSAIKKYLEDNKIASNVDFYGTEHIDGKETIGSTGVVVFTDKKLMEEKGYRTIAVDYSNEKGYVFTVMTKSSTHFEIRPEDKPCLLGLFEVTDLDKLYNLFKNDGVTSETLQQAENESIFLKYFYQSEDVA